MQWCRANLDDPAEDGYVGDYRVASVCRYDTEEGGFYWRAVVLLKWVGGRVDTSAEAKALAEATWLAERHP